MAMLISTTQVGKVYATLQPTMKQHVSHSNCQFLMISYIHALVSHQPTYIYISILMPNKQWPLIANLRQKRKLQRKVHRWKMGEKEKKTKKTIGG